MARTLLQTHRLDSIICAKDTKAIGALGAVRELKRDVPGELSVVGFDDIAMARWQFFNLTTIQNPIDAAVAEIVELLQLRLADTGKERETRFLSPYLIKRATH